MKAYADRGKAYADRVVPRRDRCMARDQCARVVLVDDLCQRRKGHLLKRGTAIVSWHSTCRRHRKGLYLVRWGALCASAGASRINSESTHLLVPPRRAGP
jgi:hypothetical protein